MQYKYVLALLVVSQFLPMLALATENGSELCSIPTEDCTANTTCNTTLGQVYNDCDSVDNNVCSSDCVSTYYNRLLEDPIGRRLRDCDCGSGNMTFCSRLMDACSKCTDVKKGCDEDATCKPLQTAFDNNCTAAVTATPPNCTQACRNSYMRLLNNPIGRARTICTCDPSDTACVQFESQFRSVCLDATGKPPVITGVVHTAVPPTASPTIPADNCKRVVARCSDSTACSTVLSYYSSNCTTTCTADCKVSFTGLLGNQVGTQLQLCSCKPGDEPCMAIPTGIRRWGRLCNVTVATHPPPITSTPSGALEPGKIGILLLVVLLYISYLF